MDPDEVDRNIVKIYSLISNGAESFLMKEFTYMFVFILGFSVILFVVLGGTPKIANGVSTPEDWARAATVIAARAQSSGVLTPLAILGVPPSTTNKIPENPRIKTNI